MANNNLKIELTGKAANQPKMCRTSIASLSVLVLTFLSFPTPLNHFALTVAGISLSFILAIISLFIMAFSPAYMRGKFFSCTSLVISMFLLLLIGAGASRCYPSSRLYCGTKLKGLGTAILVYQDDTQSLPDINRWEDELMETVETEKSQYICPTSKFKGSSYAINKYIYDIPSDKLVPEDLVLVFEAVPPVKSARNISGGPEILNIANHGNLGMNVLFADGHVEFVKTNGIAELKWSIDPNFVFPQQIASYISQCIREKANKTYNSKILISIISCILGLCAVVAFFVKRPIIVYFLISIIIGTVWSGLYASIFKLDPINTIYYSQPIWIAASIFIHLLLNFLQPKYRKAFKNSLPELTGIAVAILFSILWMIPAILVARKTDAYYYLIGDPKFITITQNCFWGFWFGAFQGFVWKKLFVAKKSDSSDASDRSDKE